MTVGQHLRIWRKAMSAMVLPLALVGGLLQSNADAFTVNVQDQDGISVAGFKWLLEEDNTHDPQVGVHTNVDVGDVTNNTLGISIHKSHAPVVASGNTGPADTSAIITEKSPGVALPEGRYFISVLPFGDHTSCSGTYDMGGTTVDTRGGANPIVTVYVRLIPIESAQIAV